MNAKIQSVIGANAGRSRSHNRQVVLGHIKTTGPMGRAQIARASGLSTQAVSNIIADLLDDGFLREDGRLSTGRGLPAVQYALNPKGGFAFGVEIRPDAIFAALLNLEGRALFSRREALSRTDPKWVRDRVVALRDAALAETGVQTARVLGAGLVLPGPFGTTGLTDAGSELPGWQQVDAATWFAQGLDLAVYVENDANATAMAERVSGAAQGFETYAFLYFGTGLGLGLVSQGRLIRGAFGNAGEIGHIPVPGPLGPVALEQAVSRLSAQKHLKDHGITADSIADLDQLFQARSPALCAWLEKTRQPLGHALTTIENLFDPQTIILGGAMPDAILDDLIVNAALSPQSVANRPDRTTPRLIRGASGRMTAALGAAALVINQSFTPEIAAA